MEALHAVARDDVAEDRERVLAGRFAPGIYVNPFEIGAPSGIELACAEPKEPVGMRVHEVRGRARQGTLRARPDEEDVRPGVDAHAYGGACAHEVRERVEAGAKLLGARLQRGGVVGVAATADLDDEIVDPAHGRVGHEVVDRAPRDDPVPDDPERLLHAPQFIAGGSLSRPGAPAPAPATPLLSKGFALA